MSKTEGERISFLEAEMIGVKGDLGEIKTTLKNLESIAQTGRGILRTVLYIGSIAGWLYGLVIGIMSLMKSGHPH